METVFNQSLWGDEGFSAILSMKSLPEILKIIAKDTSPPLWNIWEWLFFRLFGTHEIVIRCLAFIFFLGTVFFAYKIGAFLWNRKTGILAAALTFLNPFFFTYAFEGRMYSILTLGVTASMYFFLKILKAKDSKLKTFDKVGYVIATLWAMYSHHFAIFAIFLQGLWFIWEFLFGKRETAKKIFWLFVFVGIGYLPWMLPLYNQTKMVGGGFWLGTPILKDLRNLIYEYLAEGIKGHPFEIFSLKLHQIALDLVLISLIIKKWFKNIKENLFLASWFLFPILSTWGVSQLFQSIFFNRYLLYTIPAAMLLLASNRRKLTTIILAFLVIIFIMIDFHYFTHPTKKPFRELARYVKDTRQERDFLVNWNAASHHLWETKYYDIPAPIYIQGGGELPFFVGTALMQESDIAVSIPKDTVRVGVVTSGSVDEVALPGYTEEEIKTFRAPAPGGGEIHFVWLQKNEKL